MITILICFLAFRCCYCYSINPARKKRPFAPRIEPPVPVRAPQTSSQGNSKMNGLCGFFSIILALKLYPWNWKSCSEILGIYLVILLPYSNYDCCTNDLLLVTNFSSCLLWKTSMTVVGWVTRNRHFICLSDYVGIKTLMLWYMYFLDHLSICLYFSTLQ